MSQFVSLSKGDWNGVDWTGHSPKIGKKLAHRSRDGDPPKRSNHVRAGKLPSVGVSDSAGTHQMRKPDMIQTHASRHPKTDLEQSWFGVGDGASQRLTRSQVRHQTSRHASDAKMEMLARQLGILGSQQYHPSCKPVGYTPFSDVHEKPLHAVAQTILSPRQ